MTGPLMGFRVIELGGIGPGPFAGMLLADLGAEVIRVERSGDEASAEYDAHRVLLRGRRSIALDLKSSEGRKTVLALLDSADAAIEGFRPGVAERLGVGPDAALARNPALVYGRMTGWGQTGPMAQHAGHDINYLALSGALEPICAPDGTPVPPLNMLGDFGGGGMLLAVGMLAGMLHARATGTGQVVDAAIVDGSALLTAMLHSMRAVGHWPAPRGHNLLDGGAPCYGVYRTADDRWVAVGAIEPQFYARLIEGLGLRDELAMYAQLDPTTWPVARTRIATRFAERTRDEWEAVFAGVDACVTPVLSPEEASTNAHLRARGTYVTNDSAMQPAPAPRFSATPLSVPPPAPAPGEHTDDILRELGLLQA